MKPCSVLWLVVVCFVVTASSRLFDPHNHISGILPWQAYANLATFVKTGTVTRLDKENLFKFINATFSNKPLVPFTTASRLAYGAIALVKMYRERDATTLLDQELDGFLSRLLVTTPFTEFDNAYKFRSTVLSGYIVPQYSNTQDYYNDLCMATLGELEGSGISASEQAISMVGSTWTSDPKILQWLRCLSNQRTTSQHKFLIQDLTNLFGAINSTHFMSFESTGTCAVTAYASPQNLSSLYARFRSVLLENPLVGTITNKTFWDLVVGMDFAGPEVTCFTPYGMDIFYNITMMMYEVTKIRRDLGWPGEMVLHSHCGEGFAVYYANPPSDPTNFISVFGKFPLYHNPPNARTNPRAAMDNSAIMTRTIQRLKNDVDDIDCYLIFRLGHVTHVDDATAKLMASLNIEADINLDRYENHSEITSSIPSFRPTSSEISICYLTVQ
eukprot:TRINITY_DN5713_c0_g1_i1.p1 TRINITY_DN5713_c0_g1~~TRINITY_DN5713_c0_g1_i1.p1  ORF type:complete len:443 (+),score=35.90 TRINITY_DN5713_c0_g1_i1:860-2188(+)